jgi:hypothetical protein
MQTKKSWAAAQAFCQQYGWTLPTFYNADHFAVVNTEIRKLLPLGSYWTGYNDIKTEGTFEWADNSTGTLQLTAGTWNPFCNGEPNNHHGVQDTVAVVSSSCWDDTEAEGAFACTAAGDMSYRREINNHVPIIITIHGLIICWLHRPSFATLVNRVAALCQLSGAWLPAALSEAVCAPLLPCMQAPVEASLT